MARSFNCQINPRKFGIFQIKFLRNFSEGLFFVLMLLFLGSINTAQAQNQSENLPAGTLIIPMDNLHQNGTLATSSSFNVRAYGLAVRLLHADIPLVWIIDNTKSKDGIDFSANARLRYPTIGSHANRDFRSGPIAIFPGFEAQAQIVIDSFNALTGTKVNVYELQSETTVKVAQILTHKPKVALLNDGNQTSIHEDIFKAAGLQISTHYQLTTADNLSGNSCFTVATEPHSEFNDASKVTKVRNFVLDGGNFLAQCAGVRSYQGFVTGRIFATNGFIDETKFTDFVYDNHFEPFAQFQGLLATQGGSLRDMGFTTDPVGGTKIVSSLAKPNQYRSYVARASGVTSTKGGFIHFLGGHEYSGTGITAINGQRLLLNAVLRSAERPPICNLVVPEPSIEIVKTSNKEVYDFNEVVTYTFTVKNTGNVVLSNVTVTDPLVGLSAITPSTIPSLAAGATATFTANYTISQADVNAGSVTNTASVSGKPQVGPEVTASDIKTVTVTQTPALTIDKNITAGGTYSAVNDVVSYEYVITNSGNVELAGPFAVADDRIANIPSGTGPLAPGASVTVTATYTISQADLNAGSVTNTASASTTYKNETVTSNTDTETATADQRAALTIAKNITSGGTYAAVND
ncbi:MAG: hypothetical protein ACK4HU_13130, partial [Algoriphagus sp.]